MEQNCIFCKIARAEVKADAVFEDDDIKAFKDINPHAPVHILIIPKNHIESITRLESNHDAIISKMIFTAKKIAQDMNLRGYRLVFNVGREGGQVVDHLHLHLLGGWENGGLSP